MRLSWTAMICHFPLRRNQVSVHTRQRRSCLPSGSGTVLDSAPYTTGLIGPGSCLFHDPVCRCALLGGQFFGRGWTGKEGDHENDEADQRKSAVHLASERSSKCVASDMLTLRISSVRPI